MILCFECSPGTRKLLDELLEVGGYNDYSQVVSTAVENLHLLQREVAKRGSFVIGERETPHQTSMKAVMSEGLRENLFSKPGKLKSSGKGLVLIPELFQKDDLSKPPELASFPPDGWSFDEKLPLDKWVFAMYNKLLPAKANCRALAHLLAENQTGVPLSEASQTIAQAAVILGDYLRAHDKRHEIRRDDALSTAFPSSQDKGDKSITRYANQFVGNVNKKGEVSGILISLKLINYTASKDPCIHLTEAGWSFASLSNPILDGTQEKPTQKFNRDEIEFLVNHIAHHVPAENFAYRSIIGEIKGGQNTPDKLDSALRKLVSSTTGNNLTDSFLSSQRSGAISRMADLGLVERVRDAIYVEYRVTEEGSRFLTR